MEIKESKVGDITILGPVDRLDTRTSPIFEKSLEARLKQEDRFFVVDLAEIKFLTSAALRVLIMLSRRLVAAEGILILCNMNRQVREVFDIAGLSSVFLIEESRALAVKKIGAVAIGGMAGLAENLLAGQTEGPVAGRISEAGSDVVGLSETALDLLSRDRAADEPTAE